MLLREIHESERVKRFVHTHWFTHWNDSFKTLSRKKCHYSFELIQVETCFNTFWHALLIPSQGRAQIVISARLFVMFWYELSQHGFELPFSLILLNTLLRSPHKMLEGGPRSSSAVSCQNLLWWCRRGSTTPTEVNWCEVCLARDYIGYLLSSALRLWTSFELSWTIMQRFLLLQLRAADRREGAGSA